MSILEAYRGALVHAVPYAVDAVGPPGDDRREAAFLSHRLFARDERHTERDGAEQGMMKGSGGEPGSMIGHRSTFRAVRTRD